MMAETIRLEWIALSAALLVGVATAAAQRPPGAPVDGRGLRFHASVDLVRLSVTAKDAEGRIVQDLRPEEFEVYEDGIPQEIGPVGHDETPISAVVLLDRSGSMSGDKLMHAKDAVLNFTRALKPRDEVLVISFTDSVDALGGFGLDGKKIERAIKSVEAGAGTRLYDAVIESARIIAEPGRKEKRAILILSDGADTASIARLDEAVEAVRFAEVPVYAIAIEYDTPDLNLGWHGRGEDPLWRQLRAKTDVEPLHRLTDGTGGWTYAIEAAKRCSEVCVRVADELRSQYVLGYYPANRAHDAKWRKIDVRTTRPDVRLVTRSGYYAPRS